MFAVITLSNLGPDAVGPYDLYSDVDGYVSAFESNVTQAELVAGFATSNVPEFTTIIRVKTGNSILSVCSFSVDTSITTTTTTTV